MLLQPRIILEVRHGNSSWDQRLRPNGQNVLSSSCRKRASFEIVAVNDVTSAEALSHLLKYDSVHGELSKHVKVEGSHVMANGHAFEALSERDPAQLPWSRLGVQLVVEASGHFTSREKAAAHLNAGAKKVVLSAPGEGVDATFCIGVNERDFDPEEARGCFECIVHDQLPGSDRKSPARKFRHRAWADDHGACLYERSEIARRAAQRSAPSPRGGDVDDTDFDGGGSRDWLGHPRAEREA